MAAAKTLNVENSCSHRARTDAPRCPAPGHPARITLDSNSSAGRADIVVILSDTVLAGIEIKAQSPTFDKVE